MDMTT